MDIRFSYLHSANNRSESLNLDLAEIFKPIIVDRVIFTCINRGELDPLIHFEINPEDEGTYLSKDGKEVFLGNLDRKLHQTINIHGKPTTYNALIKHEILKLQKCIEQGDNYKAYKYY